MSLVTLSFLITTPETWVPALGDAEHGFPYLSGRGRLVVKDAIMLGAAVVTMADSARACLKASASSGRSRFENLNALGGIKGRSMPFGVFFLIFLFGFLTFAWRLLSGHGKIARVL